MGRPKGWTSEQTGRAPMRSPGRPQVNHRQTRRAFWDLIEAGLSSEEAAQACGVSQPLGPRWFREAGGMSPTNLTPLSGRYLSLSEREEIALLRAQNFGVREIARRLERSPSTISRELRRNAATRAGMLQYRATVAQWKAEKAARRPKATKLAQNKRLQAYVQERLSVPLPARARRLRERRRRRSRPRSGASVSTLITRSRPWPLRGICPARRPCHGASQCVRHREPA